MNFIKDRELAERFKNNAVPAHERFLYLLLFMIGVSILTSPSLFQSSQSENAGQFEIYYDIAALVTIIIGTVLAYKTNQAGDNKEFIERYISLLFPVSFRTLLIFLPISIAYAALLYYTQPSGFILENSIYEIPLIIALVLYIYWRLITAIKIAAN